MLIQKAKKNDDYGLLILKASSGSLKVYNLNETLEKTANFLTKQKQTKFSYTNTNVIKINKEVIGIIITYNSEDEMDIAKNQEKIILEKYQKKVTVVKDEGIKNTHYIDTLSVSDEYQGQGIGSKLVHYILERHSKVSLLCDAGNLKLQKFYENLGFKKIKKVKKFNHEYYQMLYQK
jgi:ribosomal protein S18 acetylase RimI-like enzyme